MNKLTLPSLDFQYFDLNVYNIKCAEDVSGNCLVTIVAPDTYVALSVFAGLYPTRDIYNVLFVGPCVSVFPCL